MMSKLQGDPASHWASEDVDSRLGWRELYATPAFMSHYHALRPFGVIRRGETVAHTKDLCPASDCD